MPAQTRPRATARSTGSVPRRLSGPSSRAGVPRRPPGPSAGGGVAGTLQGGPEMLARRGKILARLAGALKEGRGESLRMTYRTARVLECIAERPGISNREVSDHAGISDAGQISKLLRRLEGLGLMVNGNDGGHAKGVPNAWTLTPLGRQVARGINIHTRSRREAA